MEDTIDWITRNSDGREQVQYYKDTNTLLLISVRDAGELVSFVNEITPEDVRSVSVKSSEGSWQNLNLNLKHGGTMVLYYTLDKNFEIIGEVKNIRQYGISISFNCSQSMILKFKKAYIHLFQLLGVDVKDGDMF
ncbi:hypothetical protein [Aestuariivivens marinum]|uniref:hypothetical protein n=1 Tax=Aestuariivivens marinum TaxID=2913555 RepID=UPI001F5A15AB|nr:hypothetical protein [Aestuariivivens marinum]